MYITGTLPSSIHHDQLDKYLFHENRREKKSHLSRFHF